MKLNNFTPPVDKLTRKLTVGLTTRALNSLMFSITPRVSLKIQALESILGYHSKFCMNRDDPAIEFFSSSPEGRTRLKKKKKD